MKKPDAQIYNLACEQMGVVPNEFLYFGDGESNELSGAFQLGMDAVDAYLLQPGEQRKIFHSPQIENQILAAINRYLGSLMNLGIEPPYFIFITFTEIKDYTVTLITGSSEPIDRDNLSLPEFMIESEDYVIEKLIKSSFDSLYNAFGLEKHRHFNEEGSWDPSDHIVW